MKVRCEICKCYIGERPPYGEKGDKFDTAVVYTGRCPEHEEKKPTGGGKRWTSLLNE